jgi:chromate transporter
VDGITAAAIGAIIGAVFVLAKRQISDMISVVIAALTIIVLVKFKKLPEPVIILAAAGAGLAIKFF